jgi:hypothetical protein
MWSCRRRWADQPYDAAFGYRERNAVERNDAAEADGDTLNFQ